MHGYELGRCTSTPPDANNWWRARRLQKIAMQSRRRPGTVSALASGDIAPDSLASSVPLSAPEDDLPCRARLGSEANIGLDARRTRFTAGEDIPPTKRASGLSPAQQHRSDSASTYSKKVGRNNTVRHSMEKTPPPKRKERAHNLSRNHLIVNLKLLFLITDLPLDLLHVSILVNLRPRPHAIPKWCVIVTTHTRNPHTGC